MKKFNQKLLLILLGAALTLSGCGNSGSNEAASADTAAESTVETEASIDFDSMSFIDRLTYDRSNISDGLPDIDYEGYNYRIGFLDQKGMYIDDWISEGENADTVNDAVYSRNRTIEEKYGVKLSFVSHFPQSYATDVSKPILAQEDAFDMMSCHPGFYGKFTMSGYFLPLSGNEYLNFDRPWWMADSVKSYSINGVSFTAFGAATTLSLLGDSPVIFFNKTMAKNNDIEDLYNIAREGRWTYDYFLSLSKDMYNDLDGNGEVNDTDQFAMHLSLPNQTYRYIWSLGGKYVTIINGIPTLTLNNEKMQAVYDTARKLLSEKSVLATDDYSTAVFRAGNTLFENANMSSFDGFRDVEFDIGVLPNFKLDENQEKYITNGGGGPQAIPITCSDMDRSSIVMEALNAEGYKQIIPKYYEVAIKGKYTTDEESGEMLDLIYSNVVYDSCRMFCEDATFMLASYINGNNDFGSFAAKNESSLNNKLNKAIESYQSVIDENNG